MDTQKPLKKGTLVGLKSGPKRVGTVLRLFDTGFYVVGWLEDDDYEGQRCIASKELRQYRRNELVRLNSDGRYDDTLTSEEAVSIASQPGEVVLGEEKSVTNDFKPTPPANPPTPEV